MNKFAFDNTRRAGAIIIAILLHFGDFQEDIRQFKYYPGSNCSFGLDPLIRNNGSNYWIFNYIHDRNAFISKNDSLPRLTIIKPSELRHYYCKSEFQINIKCNASYPYRSVDGSCNNLQYPSWGMAGECQQRFLPTFYSEGGGYRKSVTGLPLPHVRNLSVSFFGIADKPTKALSQMFFFIGQFVAHDFSNIPSPSKVSNPCCPYDDRNRGRPDCSPMPISPDDPFYSQFNVTCNTFKRSYPCSDCNKSGYRRGGNLATAALDLNTVYGSTDYHSHLLRLKDGTGDNRVDMHSTLTSLQTLFLRSHNSLAMRLRLLNPQWQAEKLYQETRKILNGQWQNMIYGEFLPLLLGPRHMSHFGLWVGTHRYNASARIGSWIEVTGAGYRLHNQVAAWTGVRGLRFYETFQNPGLIRTGCADNLLKGACQSACQKFDKQFAVDFKHYLFKKPDMPYGDDLVSIDIKRGRDLGLPPYAKSLEYLTDGERQITEFSDLKTVVSKSNLKILKKNYKSVHDVDLWVAMQLERHPPQSSLGFSAATFTALQFYFLKYGDRFYFENDEDEATAFTEAQIESLKRSSFSQLLCASANAGSMQRHAFLLPSEQNPIVECSKIAELDLTPWKE